ncbi:MAG: glycerol-3-phosphate 1-O-acyltransferase PlsY [Bacteroidales bacterium]|nr:glycerol-3-phosphate 1-O-acyltransferase PlsY [Tenuifilaceae bacterium]
MDWILKILTIIFAYILGSIPTSIWIGRIFYNIDIRDFGSGNAGATNTFRVMGAKAGFFVFFVDMLKGFGAVKLLYLTDFYIPETGYFVNFQLMLGMTAMIGHIFPVFAKFRGGKGVATLAGVVLALHPLATLITFGIFFVTLLITKYVSLSSMIAAFSFPFLLIFAFSSTTPSLIIFAMVIAVLLLFTHQKNIERLLKGEEKRFRVKKKSDQNKSA